eukprot:29448-Pelagococcus_subviridis.AAC.1
MGSSLTSPPPRPRARTRTSATRRHPGADLHRSQDSSRGCRRRAPRTRAGRTRRRERRRGRARDGGDSRAARA